MAQVQDNTGRLWIESGEQRRALVAEVAPIIPVEHSYSFLVPDEMSGALSPGQRVEVPLGKRGRLVPGFVLSIDEKPWDSTLRPLHALLDAESYLTPELIDLGRRIAEHYACPLGRTLKAITPQAVRRGSGLATVRYAELAQPLAEIRESSERLTAQRGALLEALAGADAALPVATLLEQTKASAAVLRGLVKLGHVRIYERKEIRDAPDFHLPTEEPSFELNAYQQQALDAIGERIDAGEFSVTLLFGVSGSGKTEVYIRAMRRVLAQGRQALLLVPEIVLTTQLVQRLASRFERVAVNHSGLTDAQRSVIWRQIARGEKDVIIGTRSAVFAPCPDLGLICVDEEQESSYKNLQAPRFHVRDVAIMRAHARGIPVVLGSATPSLESWHNSEVRSHYHRLSIPQRVKDLPMPKVHVLDMAEEPPINEHPPVLSRLLEELLGQTLEQGEQAVILMNRRGYASRVFCPQCHARLECPHCHVGLVVHSATGLAVCHYCRTRIKPPTICPTVGCGGKLLRIGPGTQRVEDVITRLFPQARICRVDSDTVRHRAQYQSVVDDFETRRTDVLVGTQMIAKGLDFPFVSLVGVINAEPTALASDFRAQERLFQLITQVAGRAGRAQTAGTVVVQTLTPDSYALAAAVNHDFEAFAARELQVRRRVGLPPFRRLARFTLSHEREENAARAAGMLAEQVRALAEEMQVAGFDLWGPNPCALLRLRGKYRYELLLFTRDAAGMHNLLNHLRQEGKLKVKTATLVVDVDPVSLA